MEVKKMNPCKRFSHDVKTECKPWTNENFGGSSDSDDFKFIIVGDRAGRPVQGMFARAVDKINLLNPDFVMSVGDFIPGLCFENKSQEFILRQWEAFEKERSHCEPPFFHVVGNHDICHQKHEFFTGTYDMLTRIWQEKFGVTYYSFVFKNVLFMCMHPMEVNSDVEDISDRQLAWALETLEANRDVRWTFVFSHLPLVWNSPNFETFTNAMNERNYTVFSGDFHNYVKCQRHGRNYYIIGMTGTESPYAGYPPRGVPYGEFQSLTWVTFKDGEPRVSLLALDEVHDDDMVTIPELTWLTPSYFHGDRPLSAAEADALEAKGLKIYREIGDYRL